LSQFEGERQPSMRKSMNSRPSACSGSNEIMMPSLSHDERSTTVPSSRVTQRGCAPWARTFSSARSSSSLSDSLSSSRRAAYSGCLFRSIGCAGSYARSLSNACMSALVLSPLDRTKAANASGSSRISCAAVGRRRDRCLSSWNSPVSPPSPSRPPTNVARARARSWVTRLMRIDAKGCVNG
jgi:hypothetical protein